MIDVLERERQAIALMDEWPWGRFGVLIGGYSISAYTRGRVSQDLDITATSKEGPEVLGWLQDRGFQVGKEWEGTSHNSSGLVYRLERDLLTLDILLEAVRDRQAGVDIPVAWVQLRARRMRLPLRAGTTSAEVAVARPEAIWALKLAAGRPTDVSDLFALSEVSVDPIEVRALFEQLWCASLQEKLSRTLRLAELPKMYEDTMSRLGHKRSEVTQAKWTRMRRIAREMVPARAP